MLKCRPMTEIDILKNEGIFNIGTGPNAWKDSPRTIVVNGVARSGTSLVAGALHHLGLFLGDHSIDPVYEDQCLGRALDEGEKKDLQRIVADYNSRHNVWGYKLPGKLSKIQNLNKLLRNPIYIFTFKDIFSIANRNRISLNVPLIHGMKNALSDYKDLLRILERKKYQCSVNLL